MVQYITEKARRKAEAGALARAKREVEREENRAKYEFEQAERTQMPLPSDEPQRVVVEVRQPRRRKARKRRPKTLREAVGLRRKAHPPYVVGLRRQPPRVSRERGVGEIVTEAVHREPEIKNGEGGLTDREILDKFFS